MRAEEIFAELQSIGFIPDVYTSCFGMKMTCFSFECFIRWACGVFFASV